MISNDAILSPSSSKKNRRSTGLPGKLPVSRHVTTNLPSFCSHASGSLVYWYLAEASVLPLLDRGTAVVGVPLVLHDGIVREAPRNGLAVGLVGGEIGGDGFWQIESHGSSLQVSENSGALAPVYLMDTCGDRP